MHVLLIHQAFASLDEPGGTRHHELALHMVNNGHKVTILASPISYLTGKSEAAQDPFVSQQIDQEPSHNGRLIILRCYTYPALHYSFVHRVISFFSFMFSSFLVGLRVKQVDIVWGTSPPIFQGLTAWTLSFLKGVPFVFEVRDLWPAFAIAVGVLKNKILIKLSEWLEKYLYLQANLVIVNSPGFSGHVKQRGAGKIALVPNGADVAMFHPDDDGADFKRTHHLENKYIVMYAGAHGMSNDLGMLLKAAEYLRGRQDIQFVLVGDGKDKPQLQKQSEDLRLDNLLFVPPITKEKIGEALAAADVCIAILKPLEMYKTVYPNKVFDYMAAGRPVILAIDGVIRDVIDQAEAGIPVAPGDPQAIVEAVLSLANQPELGKQMGQNGRKYIESHFNRGEIGDRLINLFQELLSEVSDQ